MLYNCSLVYLGYTQVNISTRETTGSTAGSDTRGFKENAATDYVPVAKMLRQQAKTLLTGRLPDALTAEKSPDLTHDGFDTNSGNSQGQTTAINPPGTRDLCLGMAVGVSAAQLVAFAGSFREVSPQADLVLFFEAATNDRVRAIIEK